MMRLELARLYPTTAPVEEPNKRGRPPRAEPQGGAKDALASGCRPRDHGSMRVPELKAVLGMVLGEFVWAQDIVRVEPPSTRIHRSCKKSHTETLGSVCGIRRVVGCIWPVHDHMNLFQGPREPINSFWQGPTSARSALNLRLSNWGFDTPVMPPSTPSAACTAIGLYTYQPVHQLMDGNQADCPSSPTKSLASAS